MVFNVVATVLYFTAFVVQLSVWSSSGRTFKIDFEYFKSSNLAAGVSISYVTHSPDPLVSPFISFRQCFGLFNTVVYGVATFLLYKEKQAQPK